MKWNQYRSATLLLTMDASFFRKRIKYLPENGKLFLFYRTKIKGKYLLQSQWRTPWCKTVSLKISRHIKILTDTTTISPRRFFESSKLRSRFNISEFLLLRQIQWDSFHYFNFFINNNDVIVKSSPDLYSKSSVSLCSMESGSEKLTGMGMRERSLPIFVHAQFNY